MAPIEFELTSKNVWKLTNDELMVAIKEAKKRSLLDTLQKDGKPESVEQVKKSLEFEEKTFKIDSTWWKEEERFVDGQKEKIKVKVNHAWDVMEYLEWAAKGEQIFIGYEAFIKHVAEAKNCSPEEVAKKYLMTIEELEKKMSDKPDGSKEYEDFFNKEIKWVLAGHWDPNDETFNAFSVCSVLWLSDGHNAYFNKSK